MTSTTFRRAVLGLVGVQRIAEVVWSTRNERRLRRRGGVEHGAGHYPAMVAVHAGWLVSMFVESSNRTTRVRPHLIATYLTLQFVRYWVIRSLGDRWTTRIYVVPGEAAVDVGPYRWLRHPNYVVVAAEIALLPSALGAPRTARLFTIANALLMAVRIPSEQRALRSCGGGPTPATLPHRR